MSLTFPKIGTVTPLSLYAASINPESRENKLVRIIFLREEKGTADMRVFNSEKRFHGSGPFFNLI